MTRRRSVLVVLLALVMACAAAQSASDLPDKGLTCNDQPGNTARVQVGPQGGYHRFGNGHLLVVPGGAYPAPTTLEILQEDQRLEFMIGGEPPSGGGSLVLLASIEDCKAKGWGAWFKRNQSAQADSTALRDAGTEQAGHLHWRVAVEVPAEALQARSQPPFTGGFIIIGN